MRRRDFGRALAAGSIGALTAGCRPSPVSTTGITANKPQMYAGGDVSGEITTAKLQFLKRHGVNHVLGRSSILSFTPGKGWDVHAILTAKEQCEKEGLTLDLLALPDFAGTTHYRMDGSTYMGPQPSNLAMKNIVLGKSPERDREIEVICKTIEQVSKAGIRALHYNFLILPHQRTEDTRGRGGVYYSSFDIDKVKNHSITEVGRVSRDEVFERIAYFHERVIPVAEENRVQMSCHPPDPPIRPTFRGVDLWDYPMFDGLKRFVETVDSPYNGLTFCVGTVAEGLEDITEIYKIIRYFGERKKIFHIHFRNIRGGLHDFQEVFPDEGEMDMFRVAKILGEVGYPYMLMVDHTPRHPDAGSRDQAYAFQLGYIIALIQAATRTA